MINILQANYLLSFISSVKDFDYSLFSKINGEWHSHFFDVVMTFSREPYFWLPLYFFLILFTTINFGRQGWYWVLFLTMTAMISDFTASTLIKDNIMRLRPCRDPSIADHVRFLVRNCGLNSSFVSSHACNSFTAAMFIFVTFRKKLGNVWSLIFFWALIQSYAQIYVGVHFPTDVFCGIIVGLIIGYISGNVFNNRIALTLPELNKKLWEKS